MDFRAFLDTGIPTTEDRGFAGITARATDKPLITAVEGYALGGGFEIALACDIIVASRSARFGLPEVKLGLVAGAGGIMRLPQRLPYHVAMRLILTGDILDASEAERYGLLSVQCEDGTATATAASLAVRIAANGPLAIRASKRLVQAARVWPEEEMFDRQRQLVDPVLGSADAREGVDAFLKHRTPIWRAH
jgi:enoyl-CoA hydratase